MRPDHAPYFINENKNQLQSVPVQTPSFHFRKHRERIDWRMIAAVDVDDIMSGVDVSALQNNLTNITFCDIQTEIGPYLDPNFVKIFRIAQLTIEYLLHSQECLSSALSRSEQLYLTLKEQKVHSKKSTVKHAVVHSKRKKRSTSNVVVADLSNRHQCVHCQKLFLNNLYLDMHLVRRHSNQIIPSSVPQASDELVRELRAVKDQLIASQSVLQEKQEAANDVNKELELKEVKDLLFKELTSVDEKCRTMEKQLKFLQQTKEFKCEENVAEPRIKTEETASYLLMENQKQEIKQLKLQLSSLEAYIKQKDDPPATISTVETLKNNEDIVKGHCMQVQSAKLILGRNISREIPEDSITVLRKPISNEECLSSTCTSDSSLGNTRIQPKEILTTALKNDPAILKGIRDELLDILDGRLNKLGILSNVNEINDATLNEKLDIQCETHRELNKKYEKLQSIRQRLNATVTSLASVKYKQIKKRQRKSFLE